jgi:UDP-N-acetylglucosamine 2-epimerase (non-hydrolysing)
MIINALCVFGTRPEALKMVPLIKKIRESTSITTKICISGQHQELIKPVLDLFQIKTDFDLQVMTPNQEFCEVTSRILKGLAGIFTQFLPELVIVQGDTTTALAAALAAYYHRIPVAHIEAGLRSGSIDYPWPEEANRKLIGSLASLHFAPTQTARQNLLHEGIAKESIYVTGNTIIDVLYDISNQLDTDPEMLLKVEKTLPFLEQDKKIILVTGHRQEHFGAGFECICQALLYIANKYPQINIVYPVHLNPKVRLQVQPLLKGINNIHLIEPVDYLAFVYLMKRAYLILTDSGGIQEEAPALGKPVLIMRNITERPEGVTAGVAKLVGSQPHTIIEAVEELLHDPKAYQKMSQAKNPYGDGQASSYIVDIIAHLYTEQPYEPITVEKIKDNYSAIS